MNKTYLNRNVVELSDKSVFDPIHKVLRRQHSQQVRADHVQMFYKDKMISFNKDDHFPLNV